MPALWWPTDEENLSGGPQTGRFSFYKFHQFWEIIVAGPG